MMGLALPRQQAERPPHGPRKPRGACNIAGRGVQHGESPHSPRKSGFAGAIVPLYQRGGRLMPAPVETGGEGRWQRVKGGGGRRLSSSLYWSGFGQIDWYHRKAKANQRAYKVSKISIIVLAILIPVFAEYGHIPGFEDSRGFLVGALPPASSCCWKGSRC